MSSEDRRQCELRGLRPRAKDPNFDPFDRADAEAFPYEEMINPFIETVTRGLGAGAAGKATG